MASDGKLIFDTKLDTSGFEKGVSGLGAFATQAGNRIVKIAGLAKAAVVTGAKAMTAGLGAFGVYSLKAGSDFDASMSQVSAISGATGDDLQALRDKAKEMGASTKFSATQSAEALKYMGMAGWSSQEMLEGLPGVMNLAAASGEDLGVVSDIVTDSLTAFGLTAKDTGMYVDVLAAASTASNTDVGTLGETFGYVAPLAGALGYSVQDVSVALGLMANAGVKGSRAGTALRSALTRLASPTKQAQDTMNELGISITDSAGEIKPFNQLLKEVRSSFAGLSEEQKAQAVSTLFGQEAMAGMLAIIDASDEDFNSLTNSINNSAGAAEKMAKIMNDNLKGDVVILMSALEGLGISLFENVDTPLRTIVQNITSNVGKLNKALMNDIGSVPKILGDMIAEGAVAIAQQAPSMIDAGKDIFIAFLEGLESNADKLADSAVKIIISLASAFMESGYKLLTVGGDLLLRVGEGLASNAHILVPKAIEIIGKLAQGFVNNAPRLIKVGLDLLKAIAKGIADNPEVLAEAVPSILQAFALAFALFKGKEVGLSLLKSLASGLKGETSIMNESGIKIIDSLSRALNNNGQELWLRGSLLIEKLAGGLKSKVTPISQAGTNIITTLSTAISTGAGKISAIGGTIVTKLGSAMTALSGSSLGQAASTIISTLVGGLSKGIALIAGVAGKIIPLIATVLSNPVGLVIVGGLLIAAVIKGFNIDVPKLLNSAGKLVGSIARKITDGAKGLLNAGKNLISNIAKGFTGAISAFVNSSPAELLSKLGNALKNGAKGLIDAGKGFIQGIKDGWNGKKDEVTEEAKKLPDNINDAIDPSDTEPTGRTMVQGVVEGLQSGTTNVSDAYNQLIKAGLTDSEARAIIRQEGNASVQEYATGLLEGAENVRGAYTALRTSGLDELAATEEFFQIAGINLDGYINGTEEGGLTYREKLKELMDGGKTELEAVEELYEIAKKNIDGFNKGSEAGSEGIKNTFSTMMDIGLSELEAFDEMYQKGQLNVDAFGTGSESGRDQIVGIYNQLREAGLSQVEAIDALYNAGLINAQGFAEGSGAGEFDVSTAYDALIQAGLSKADAQEALRSLGISNASAYASGVSGTRPTVEGAYKSTFTDPLEFRSDLLNNPSLNKGKATGEDYATGIGTAKESVTAQAEGLRTSALTGMGEATEANAKGQSVGNEYATGITQSATTVTTATTTLGNAAKQNLDSLAPAFRSAGQNSINGYANAIDSKKGQIVTSINTMGSQMTSSLQNTSTQATSNVNNMMSRMTSAVQQGSNNVNNSVKSMSNNVNNNISQMDNKVQSTSSQMMSKLSSTVQQGSNNVNNNFRTMSTNINSTMSQTSNTVTSTSNSMMNQLVNNIRNGASNATSTISNMCLQMVSTVNSYSGAFSNAGYNLMAGLANGIYGGSSGVINAAIHVMNQAVWAAKRAASIHSPSRVWNKEVGAMLSTGLAIGIEDKADLAIKSTQDMMQAIRNKARGAIEYEMLGTSSMSKNNLTLSRYGHGQELDVNVNNGDVTAIIELDGRELGRAVSPIVSQEISKDRRRRG